jgi:hypothetical protein
LLCGFPRSQGPLPAQGLIHDSGKIVVLRLPAEAPDPVDPGHELRRIARAARTERTSKSTPDTSFTTLITSRTEAPWP